MADGVVTFLRACDETVYRPLPPDGQSLMAGPCGTLTTSRDGKCRRHKKEK